MNHHVPHWTSKPSPHAGASSAQLATRSGSLCILLSRCHEQSQYQPGDQSSNASNDNPDRTASFTGTFSGDGLCDCPVCSVGDRCHGWVLTTGLFHQIEVALQRLVDLEALEVGQLAKHRDDPLQFCVGLITKGIRHWDVRVHRHNHTTGGIEAEVRTNRL